MADKKKTGGGQALDASRTPAFTFLPHELILVTKSGQRFYSPTVNDPVSDQDVLDAAVRGILISLRVRRTDEGSVVTAGRQRTKRALIANHLAGIHKYTGALPSVLDAIKRLKGTDKGDQIAEVVNRKWPGGLMLRAFAANGGSDADAEADGVAEDEIRRGGPGTPWQQRAERARQLMEGGYSLEQAAQTLKDVSPATLKRWLKRLDAGDLKDRDKKRGKAMRPGAKKVQAMIDRAQVLIEGGSNMPTAIRAALRWAAGQLSEEQFIAECPWLVEAEDGAKKGEAAA